MCRPKSRFGSIQPGGKFYRLVPPFITTRRCTNISVSGAPAHTRIENFPRLRRPLLAHLRNLGNPREYARGREPESPRRGFSSSFSPLFFPLLAALCPRGSWRTSEKRGEKGTTGEEGKNRVRGVDRALEYVIIGATRDITRPTERTSSTDTRNPFSRRLPDVSIDRASNEARFAPVDSIFRDFAPDCAPLFSSPEFAGSPPPPFLVRFVYARWNARLTEAFGRKMTE